MASFVPYHRKKKETLVRKEETLRRLIERGVDRKKLLDAALEVRDGRIAVLRAKQNQNPERSPEERRVFLADKEKINFLQTLTADEILVEFLHASTSN